MTIKNFYNNKKSGGFRYTPHSLNQSYLICCIKENMIPQVMLIAAAAIFLMYRGINPYRSIL